MTNPDELPEDFTLEPVEPVDDTGTAPPLPVPVQDSPHAPSTLPHATGDSQHPDRPKSHGSNGNSKNAGRGQSEPAIFEGQCDAWSRQNNRRCRNKIVNIPGATKCRMHGGFSPRGVAAANFQGRGYSKDIPMGLVQAYERAENDPDLMSMRSEVALIQMRIAELVRSLGTGENGSLWQDTQESYAAFKHAMSIRDDAAAGEALERMGTLIERGMGTWETWQELQRTIDLKTQVAAREWKRMVDLRQTLTVEDAYFIINSIALSVTRHVKDETAKQNLAADMQLVLHGLHRSQVTNREK